MAESASRDPKFVLSIFGDASVASDEDSPGSYRECMARYPAVVNIVATGSGINRRGFTASAVFSVSMEPPMIGVCVNKGVEAHDHLLRNRFFCINVLNRDQEPVANRFAARDGSKGASRFEHDDWRMLATGSPVLSQAAASMDCELAAAMDVGTHTLMVGRVKAACSNAEQEPLLYFRRKFAGAHVLRNAGVPLAVAPIDGW